MFTRLEDFVRVHYPELIKQYNMQCFGFGQFKVGMKLRMLRAGFCGQSGVIRVITKICKGDCGDYLELEAINPRSWEKTSLLYEKDTWWKDCEIID